MRGSALSVGSARSHLLLPRRTIPGDGRCRGGAGAAPPPPPRPSGAAPWAAPEGGGAGLAGARRERVAEVIEQADYLYGSGETEKLYRLLVQHKNSEDAELLWRLARASRDLAQLSITSAEEKRQLAYDSLEYAKKALEKNESNSAAHKWYAICLSDVGDYEGIKVKIGNAFIIKEHFERAIELNPKDATSIHLIGIWCYSFAELPWYQRKIAAMLFAAPPTSTYEEALRYFHKAEEADPNFYSKNLLFLGKTYLKLNNKKMALLWLSKAKEYPAHTEEDKQRTLTKEVLMEQEQQAF
ncbi:regulator of microtubule dynamics protein 1 isoform X3 [Numida meleagris]|uniref:regulator of microtubule dynamics protein 1 isoform X3 n=1 Tax=Numida meleagris TaxID=8996 RepID=UPI000B3E1402|nr:regulator of microtubule dynamics protein 1 isoform X3 [Numida meleagris]